MTYFLLIKKKIRNIFSLFKGILSSDHFIPYKGFKKVDLLIYDDIFPHPVSGFRYEEYKVLLTEFVDSKIIMTPNAYPVVKTPIIDHESHVNSFIKLNYELRDKLKFKKGLVNINTKLFYCVFINNIFVNLEWIEKYKIPFVFTLYPGGGFQLDDISCDLKLKKVFSSPMFRKVIVTQQFTLDYLVNKNFCKVENIEFIFGGVVPQLSLKKDLINKKRYLIHKKTFDICFCAAKYTLKGKDKGYDVFIEFAHNIAAKFDFIRFHVIGGFSENDDDIRLIKDKIKFYGYLNFESLSAIFKNMDVFVSPNKPFILAKGAFDGFPLGTVVEASLNGVVSLISDKLNQNIIFKSSEELIIIDSNSRSIEKEIIDLINHPDKLYSISEKGKNKFSEVYSNEMQMNPRILLLQSEIAKT